MKRIIVSLLFLSHSLFSCDRTPPADPAQLEAWISHIVEPVNRHRGINIQSLEANTKARVAQKATDRLQRYLEEKPYRNDNFQPSQTPSVFFDTIQFLLGLQADATQCPDLLVDAQDMAGFHRLGIEYENFALQIIEDKKCSATAAINFLYAACLGSRDSDKLASACISHIILPSLEQMPQPNKTHLAWVINERISGKRASTPTSQLLELFKQLKERLNAQTTS